MPTSPRTADAEGSPVPPGQHRRRARRGIRRREYAKAKADFTAPGSRGLKGPVQSAPQPRKGFQNHGVWRRSFLPFFRRRKKGSHRRRNAGGRIVTPVTSVTGSQRHITGNAEDNGRRSEGTPPYGGQQGGGGAGGCGHRPARNNNGKRGDKSKTGG